MTPKKILFLILIRSKILFLILIRSFSEILNLLGNLMYEIPDKGLQVETFTYSLSVDSIIQTDPSLIQLSILLKTS